MPLHSSKLGEDFSTAVSFSEFDELRKKKRNIERYKKVQ